MRDKSIATKIQTDVHVACSKNPCFRSLHIFAFLQTRRDVTSQNHVDDVINTFLFTLSIHEVKLKNLTSILIPFLVEKVFFLKHFFY